MRTKGIVVAGLSGGSGKSVVSVGLTACLKGLGKKVVPFKKGPDYIDAGWMALAAGQQCYNLDPYLMTEEAIHTSVLRYTDGTDFVVVEGNRGLYDGVNSTGGYSTAELAISLNLPVILVVNCTKTTRTVAAMVLGCKVMDDRLDIRGVILNHVATERQKKIITEAVEKITGIPVLGVVPRMKRDIFPMRHLGVIPHKEYSGSDSAISFLAKTISESVDMVAIQEAMADISLTLPADVAPNRRKDTHKVVRIGVIQDAAFQFYYAENLNALKTAGAKIIPINALENNALPHIDGLYIGGGFPETSAKELASNAEFRASVKKAAEDGLPIYAECGGLIYLGESISLENTSYPLVGVFPVHFGMSHKPQAHGYSIFNVDRKTPYYAYGSSVKGHEFRYSTILEWRGDEKDLALKMKRGVGFSGGRDGLTYNNVLAMYTHIHAGGTPEWALNFVDHCRQCHSNRSV